MLNLKFSNFQKLLYFLPGAIRTASDASSSGKYCIASIASTNVSSGKWRSEMSTVLFGTDSIVSSLNGWFSTSSSSCVSISASLTKI